MCVLDCVFCCVFSYCDLAAGRGRGAGELDPQGRECFADRVRKIQTVFRHLQGRPTNCFQRMHPAGIHIHIFRLGMRFAPGRHTSYLSKWHMRFSQVVVIQKSAIVVPAVVLLVVWGLSSLSTLYWLACLGAVLFLGGGGRRGKMMFSRWSPDRVCLCVRYGFLTGNAVLCSVVLSFFQLRACVSSKQTTTR